MVRENEVALEITYYTDPLCCWSWGFEPQWRKLVYQLRGKLRYRYAMAGLLPDWKYFHDSLNSVSRPLQMGPVWMHAKELSRMPVNYKIWMTDPPSSSYPACVAVKCAELQSATAAEQYLRMLREAVMIHEQNISKKEVLLEIAQALAHRDDSFDWGKLKADIGKDECLEAFRADVQEVKLRNIRRFPALIMKNSQNQALYIDGYKPYDMVVKALESLGVAYDSHPIDEEEYKAYWGSLTDRELEEIRK